MSQPTDAPASAPTAMIPANTNPSRRFSRTPTRSNTSGLLGRGCVPGGEFDRDGCARHTLLDDCAGDAQVASGGGPAGGVGRVGAELVGEVAEMVREVDDVRFVAGCRTVGSVVEVPAALVEDWGGELRCCFERVAT